jgi:hypothetical protein
VPRQGLDARDALALDQLGREMDRLGVVARVFYLVHQKIDGNRAHLVVGHPNRGQRGHGSGGKGQVVEADDRDVLWNLDACLAHRAHGAKRHDVALRKEGRRQEGLFGKPGPHGLVGGAHGGPSLNAKVWVDRKAGLADGTLYAPLAQGKVPDPAAPGYVANITMAMLDEIARGPKSLVLVRGDHAVEEDVVAPSVNYHERGFGILEEGIVILGHLSAEKDDGP